MVVKGRHTKSMRSGYRLTGRPYKHKRRTKITNFKPSSLRPINTEAKMCTTWITVVTGLSSEEKVMACPLYHSKKAGK